MFKKSLIVILFFIILNCSNENKNKLDKNQKNQPSKSITKTEFKKVSNIELIDFNGNKTNLYALQGKIILVNLWGSWIENAFDELDYIVRLNNEFKNSNFTIVSICYGFPNITSFQKLLLKKNIKFPVYLGNPKITKVFPLAENTLPSSYILNTKLEIIKEFQGKQDFDTLKKNILFLLKDNK